MAIEWLPTEDQLRKGLRTYDGEDLRRKLPLKENGVFFGCIDCKREINMASSGNLEREREGMMMMIDDDKVSLIACCQ